MVLPEKIPTADPTHPTVVRIAAAIGADAGDDDAVATALRVAGVDVDKVRRQLAKASPWDGDGAGRWRHKTKADGQFLAGEAGVRMAELVDMGDGRATVHLYVANPDPDPEWRVGSPLDDMVGVSSVTVPMPANRPAVYELLERRLAEPAPGEDR